MYIGSTNSVGAQFLFVVFRNETLVLKAVQVGSFKWQKPKKEESKATVCVTGARDIPQHRYSSTDEHCSYGLLPGEHYNKNIS